MLSFFLLFSSPSYTTLSHGFKLFRSSSLMSWMSIYLFVYRSRICIFFMLISLDRSWLLSSDLLDLLQWIMVSSTPYLFFLSGFFCFLLCFFLSVFRFFLVLVGTLVTELLHNLCFSLTLQTLLLLNILFSIVRLP